MSAVRESSFNIGSQMSLERLLQEKPSESRDRAESGEGARAFRTTRLEFRESFSPTEDLADEDDTEPAQAKEARSADGPPKPKGAEQNEQAGEAKAEQGSGNIIGDILGGICKGIGDFFKGIGEMIFGKVTDDNPNDGTKHVMTPGGGGAEVDQQAAEGVKTDDGRSPIIVVGGAGGTLKEGEDFAQFMADQTGDPTRLIHNATNRKEYQGGLLGGLMTDVSRLADGVVDFNQVSDDWYGKGKNPCVDAVKDQVREQLMNGTGEARLAGFSQGNEIIARALRELAEEPGMADKMKNISVMNMSGPVRKEDYPSGINYDHLEMASDPVSNKLGEAIPDQSGVDARNANYHDTLWGLASNQPWWGHSPNILLGDADGTAPDIGADVLAGMGVANMDDMMAIEDANRQRMRALFGL